MSEVILIDSNPVFRLGLRELVGKSHPDVLVIEADTLRDARQKMAAASDLALVVLDLKVSDSGGFVGLSQLRNEYPKAPIIICCETADTETVSRAVAFGAAAFIAKSAQIDLISRTLGAVLNQENWSPIHILVGAERLNPIASLSPAQLRVLKSLKANLKNKEMAATLGLTEKTVKAYMSTLYKLLGVNSRAQALVLVEQFISSQPEHTDTI